MNCSRRRAFTLVELLVVIAIIGILMAIMLPAVQATRDSARRVTCSNQLSQLIIAVNSYETSHGVYPPGTIEPQGPIRNQPQGFHHNWIIQLLPYLEERNAHQHIDQTVGVYDPKNSPVRDLTIGVLICPTDGGQIAGKSSYAGVHHDIEAPIDVDQHGVFFLNSRLRYDQVTDGSSTTLYLGEKIIDLVNPSSDLGWMSGTSATLRNTGAAINGSGRRNAPPLKPAANPAASDAGNPDGDPPAPTGVPLVGGFGSFHPQGANFAFGDGSIKFLSENISITVYRQLGHRADGQLLDRLSY